MLIVFGLLIWGGLTADTSSMSFAKTLRNTNLANLLVWSYWWPALIVATVFFGRVWCTVCPMELLTTLAAKVGLKRTPPALMKRGWLMTAFYVVILFVGIHTFAIHRVPLRMAVYMLVLLGAALITGLVYHKNTFCAHLCPVGHLLGLYARLAPFDWGVKSTDACARCKDKSCVAEENRYSLTAPSCQVGLYPPRVTDNTQCLLCGNCVKSCAAGSAGAPDRPNPEYRKRRFFQDILDLRPISPAHALFVTVVAGFVVYEILGEWRTTREVLMYLPHQVTTALSLSGTAFAGLGEDGINFAEVELVNRVVLVNIDRQ